MGPKGQDTLNQMAQQLTMALAKQEGEAPAALLIVAVWRNGDRPGCIMAPKLDAKTLMALGDRLLKGAMEAVSHWKRAVNTRREPTDAH